MTLAGFADADKSMNHKVDRSDLAGIEAAPCCTPRRGFVGRRRRAEWAHEWPYKTRSGENMYSGKPGCRHFRGSNQLSVAVGRDARPCWILRL